MNIRISEIEQTFKEIFEEEEGKVTSVDSIYEKSDDGDFYKLVISIHGLSVQDTFIIHTKFIFKTDLEKKNVIEESLIYLYDINCVYHKVQFNNILDMKKKIEGIIESNDFGEDLQILSDFIGAPSMFLNYYLKRSKITDYSIYDVVYEPKFKSQPCDETTFDFEINVNNNYNIHLSIQKTNRQA
ncbi:MAG: hypothetical protein LC122_08765, partial [Chitinophagales bacterium]|nr:hypothetical protein [Chitinophagales bacterium]